MEHQPLMGISMSEMQASLQRDGVDHPEAVGLGTAMGLLFLYDAIPDPPVSPAERGPHSTASTASAASPTRSSRTSSPASPPRTPRAPPRSPRAGAASGAPCPSSSSTPTSSRASSRPSGWHREATTTRRSPS
uniref:Uncharacterized protein n=1 Tax=Arundo donax TaxID=35708 RepID=A0A0A9A367_ARUDO